MYRKTFTFLMIALVFSVIPPQSLAQKKIEKKVIVRASNEGWLGVYIRDVSKKLVENNELSVNNGAYVFEVIENSPADKAGINEGDVIVKFNGNDIDDADELSEIVRKNKADSEATIDVVRGKDTKTFTVKLGEFSSSDESNDSDEEENDDDESAEICMENFAPHAMFSMMEQNEFNGVSIMELNEQLAEFLNVPNNEGVLVSEVEKESDGAKAGFKAGDVITKIGGKNIDEIADLHKQFKKNYGKEINFNIWRKGTSVTLRMEVEDNDFSSNCCGKEKCGKRFRFFNFRFPKFHGMYDGFHYQLDNFNDKFKDFQYKFKIFKDKKETNEL